jgi:small-conductance mechanosensitive channel
MMIRVLALGLALAGPAMSAQASVEERPVSAVVLDGQELFRVRGVKVFTSETRARHISERLRILADDYSVSAQSLSVIEDAISTDVIAGDQILFSLLDTDAEPEGTTRQALGRAFAQKVSAAIEKYRQDRAPRNLLLSSLKALAATVLLAVLLWGVVRVHRRLVDRVRTRIRPIQLKSHEVLRAAWILQGFLFIARMTRFLLVGWILIFYLQVVLSFFPWTRPIAYQILNYVLVPLQALGAGFRDQIPNLLFVAVLSVITAYLLKFIRFFFAEVEGGGLVIPGFFSEWSKPTYNIVRVLIIGFALVVAFPYIPGSSSPAFQGVSLFLGVLFSLGSTSMVANVVAGLVLTYMRAFKVGDVVAIGDSRGVVVGVSLLVTRIRTPKKIEITIPNSMILGTHVVNYSSAAREDGVILSTSVTIGYDTPWRQVEALLLMSAERTSGVLREPAPFVLQKELGDFYITYELNVSTDIPENMTRIYSELHANIQDAFNEYGVQIMSPNYEADRDVPTYVPKERWYSAPAKPPGNGDRGEAHAAARHPQS